ncbi:MAG: ATP-grasp domain-containing protein [Snowella sp.]|nr:ATP-grasp domain-containing protein [Snowella sp.]
MDLLEYQAKALFQKVGIPVLPSQTIHEISELKRLHIPYPVVLKSQVRAGGRGKAGGIKFVENTIDAIAAASAIFNLRILDEYPEVILAEAHYDSQSEIFLAIVLDYQLQCPVLLGSSKGGMDVDTLLQYMQTVVLVEDFSPFHARRLAIKMGLKGELIAAVSDILEKMYHLFLSKDLDLVEINPLGVKNTGEVMALDGKITANDAAIARHPDLIALMDHPQDFAAPLRWLKGDIQWGQIGLICNSYGSTLTSWDLMGEQNGSLAGAFILEDTHPQLSLTDQLAIALEKFRQLPQLKVIFVNIVATPSLSEAIAEFISRSSPPVSLPTNDDRLPRATRSNVLGRERLLTKERISAEWVPLVIRLVNGDLNEFQNQVAALPIYWSSSLEQAIADTLSLTETTT